MKNQFQTLGERRYEFRRAVARMKEADVLRKRDEQVAPVETKQPKVDMVTLEEHMKQWPKRKG